MASRPSSCRVPGDETADALQSYRAAVSSVPGPAQAHGRSDAEGWHSTAWLSIPKGVALAGEAGPPAAVAGRAWPGGAAWQMPAEPSAQGKDCPPEIRRQDSSWLRRNQRWRHEECVFPLRQRASCLPELQLRHHLCLRDQSENCDPHCHRKRKLEPVSREEGQGRVFVPLQGTENPAGLLPWLTSGLWVAPALREADTITTCASFGATRTQKVP